MRSWAWSDSIARTFQISSSFLHPSMNCVVSPVRTTADDKYKWNVNLFCRACEWKPHAELDLSICSRLACLTWSRCFSSPNLQSVKTCQLGNCCPALFWFQFTCIEVATLHQLTCFLPAFKPQPSPEQMIQNFQDEVCFVLDTMKGTQTFISIFGALMNLIVCGLFITSFPLFPSRRHKRRLPHNPEVKKAAERRPGWPRPTETPPSSQGDVLLGPPWRHGDAPEKKNPLEGGERGGATWN